MIGLSLLQADYIRDDTKEVVLDTSTNLMWQDDVTPAQMNWTDALSYCENSNLGGFSDWRLPNFNELYMIADRTTFSPAISSVFTNVVSDRYWSSTTRKTATTYAWAVQFDNGTDNARVKSDMNYIRCVR
jgi:hypothetical protein